MAVPPPISDPASPNSAKPALRAELRARRQAHVATLPDMMAASEAAATIALPHIPVGATVALYLALRDEIDPGPLAAMLAARGQSLCLPWLGNDSTMIFRGWAPGDALMRGPFTLRQPLAGAPPCAPTVIVTPLVGFDRAGGRIGQGAGHYDRAFAQLPGARRIGFAWSVQEVPALPHDPWDVALHAIATEHEWIVV